MMYDVEQLHAKLGELIAAGYGKAKVEYDYNNGYGSYVVTEVTVQEDRYDNPIIFLYSGGIS